MTVWNTMLFSGITCCWVWSHERSATVLCRWCLFVGEMPAVSGRAAADAVTEPTSQDQHSWCSSCYWCYSRCSSWQLARFYPSNTLYLVVYALENFLWLPVGGILTPTNLPSVRHWLYYMSCNLCRMIWWSIGLTVKIFDFWLGTVA